MCVACDTDIIFGDRNSLQEHALGPNQMFEKVIYGWYVSFPSFVP